MAKSKVSPHSFYIPVMGTAFTVDAPLRVGKFGISSVMSIGDDELCESMRKYYSEKEGLTFEPIKKSDIDYRPKRITAYLNLVDQILANQIKAIKAQTFDEGTELTAYFEMLGEKSELKKQYVAMKALPDSDEKSAAQDELRKQVVPGSIDVNIMTKIDKINYKRSGEMLPEEYSDALTALRGYAESTLQSSIIFSAGFNRRLYAYITKFKDFFPDSLGNLKKKVVIKVSDFRSSLIQGKFLAKKGTWVSEYRIESGLNCGGHAFPSEGKLLGPILDVFKQKKDEFFNSMFEICNNALTSNGKQTFSTLPETKITVQGGIGTVNEDEFLRESMGVDETGWASPFLLVPEATNVDDDTRKLLVKAKKEDLYLSDISPLGVPFNTVKGTASEIQKLNRVEIGRPGSPCPKGHLVSNVEFTEKPICTASVLYQRKKLKQLEESGLTGEALKNASTKVTNKACLCEDLAASAIINAKQDNKRPLKSAICPGPNLAYFSRLLSLKEMVSHIYGRVNVLNPDVKRSNMFISELKMYVKYLKKEVNNETDPDKKRRAYFEGFKDNLFEGIEFYKQLFPTMKKESSSYQTVALGELSDILSDLEAFINANSGCFNVSVASA